MRIRRSIFALLVCAFALSIAACGSDSEEGGTAITPASVATQDALIQAFEPPEGTTITQSDSESKVVYGWSYEGQYEGEEPLPHCGDTIKTTTSATVVVAFENVQSKSTAAIDDIWNTQNEGRYADKDLQAVSDVGNRATWVLKGGISNGELRVATEHYIFYIRIQSNWVPEPCPGQSHEFFAKEDAIEFATSFGKSIASQLEEAGGE